MTGLRSIKHMTLIFITCLLTYLLFWSGRHYSIDGIVMFEYAKTLLFQRSFLIDPPIFWANLEIRTSVWSLGLTLVYLIILAVLSSLFPGNMLFRQIPNDPHNPYYPLLLENTPYRYASLIHPVITALTATLVYVLSRQLGLSKKGAWAAALIFGLASPAAAFAKYDFAQPLVSLLLLTAIVSYNGSPTHTATRHFITGLMVGLAIITRPEMAVIAGIPFCIVVLWDQIQENGINRTLRRRKTLSLMGFMLPLGACVLILIAANVLRFDFPFSTGFSFADFNFKSGLILEGLIGTVASPVRGIFFFFPLSLLAILGTPQIYRRNRSMGFLVSWIILISILLYASWSEWGGGRSWGPRFLVPILPYLTVLAVLGYGALSLRSRAISTATFCILLALGWTASLQGQLFDSMMYVTKETMLHLPSSPILSGWATFTAPLSYDIFWVKKIANGQPLGLQFPAILLTLLGICAYTWFRLFLNEDKDCEVSDSELQVS